MENGKCQTDIDECSSSSNPCLNGGKCMNTIGSFECDCSGTGYEGPLCTIDVNECLDSPCLNGGVCQNQIGSYR